MKQVNTDYELGNISATKELEQLKTLLNEKYKLELETFNKIRMLWEKYPRSGSRGKPNSVGHRKARCRPPAAENKASLEIHKTWTKALTPFSVLEYQLDGSDKGNRKSTGSNGQYRRKHRQLNDQFVAREFAQFVDL